MGSPSGDVSSSGSTASGPGRSADNNQSSQGGDNDRSSSTSSRPEPSRADGTGSERTRHDDPKKDKSFSENLADARAENEHSTSLNNQSTIATNGVPPRVSEAPDDEDESYSVVDVGEFLSRQADTPDMTAEQSQALANGAAVIDGYAMVPTNPPATGPRQGMTAYDAAIAMGNAEFGVGMETAYREANVAADKAVTAYDQEIATIDDRLADIKAELNPTSPDGSSTFGMAGGIAPQQARELIDEGRTLTEQRADLESKRGQAEAARDLPNAIDMAHIAKDVYSPTSSLVGSHLQRMSHADLEARGFNTAVLENPETGFSADIYHNAITDQVVLAYEGTNFDSVADWKANFGQGLGLPTAQYQQAERAAVEFAKAFPDQDRAITGHSLGGGLAAYGSLSTGTDATTFNAAGLQENSLERLGVTRERASDLVTAYNVEGDILSTAQDSRKVDFGLKVALGPARILLPNDVVPEAVGARYQHPARTSTGDLPDWSGGPKADAEQALDLHFIDAQINTLWNEYERHIGQ